VRPLTDSSSTLWLLIRALFMQDRLSVIVTGLESQYAHMQHRGGGGLASARDVTCVDDPVRPILIGEY
jgi:hypothetical protein